MFPTSFVDKVNCMQSLMGIRTQCLPGEQYPFWIEDIEGVDVKNLAALAKATNTNGKDFGKQLINNAARQMMGDIETLLNNGYKMNAIAGDMCSACTFITSYTANSGIVVKSNVGTSYGILHITSLNVLTNVTGTRTMKIDDGVDPKLYDVELIAGTMMPLSLNYSTTQKFVKITFTDITVGLGHITCATQSSCGCGGSSTSHNPVKIAGLVAGIETTSQFGFLPCASVTCSYDSLVCHLIKQTPNIFGLALLYKTGELYYDILKVSTRNNEAVSFNEEDKEEQKKNYARLYWAKIKGTSGVTGINTLIGHYLKTNRGDKCVTCESKVRTAYVTG